MPEVLTKSPVQITASARDQLLRIKTRSIKMKDSKSWWRSHMASTWLVWRSTGTMVLTTEDLLSRILMLQTPVGVVQASLR